MASGYRHRRRAANRPGATGRAWEGALWTLAPVVGLAAASFAASCPGGAAADGLAPGTYRVLVHIALPNVETRDYDFETEICWRGADDAEMPLGPLGPGPLAHCPADAADTAEGVVVTVACPGPNAGFAKGRYRRTETGFTGRVEMDLGGKNMTLAEEQRAIRTGPCG